MRTIRPAAKAPKHQLMVAKPGAAPAKVPAPTMSLQPPAPGPASTRDYGKAQPPQISPPGGLPGSGI